ncbi:MAG: hypothetical protein FD180_4663 [Planctomycetota bacterium]|nr:MAG: hypothetical protein FD180_4663 [Planctomycetota bacterium]
MTSYEGLITCLGQTWESGPLVAALAPLGPHKGPVKEGAYQACITFKKQGLYFSFRWEQAVWRRTQSATQLSSNRDTSAGSTRNAK